MLEQRKAVAARQDATTLVCSLARTPADVRDAQELRYRVFAEELGARLPGRDGIDCDGYDALCEHLLVREQETGMVVGTYRILPPEMARAGRGYYSASKFDLGRLELLFDHTVEVGRSCVHPDYRNGAAIALLWAGIAKYMRQHCYRYLIGCASISMADGGHIAASLYNRLKGYYLAPAEYRVFPRCPLPWKSLRNDLNAPCPPLIKGYLRAGAQICGEPAWDPDFNTADLLVMLSINRLDQRYASHFLRN